MNPLRAVFAICLSLVSCQSVDAQCATGVNTGSGGCAPPEALNIPGYENANDVQAALPPYRWVDLWGAIAIDPDTGQAGTPADMESESAAIRAAMHDCSAKGATGCRLRITYHNQCAAVAWGPRGNGVGSGPEPDAAQEMAMKSCEDTTCKIVYSNCTYQRKVIR